MLTGNQINFRAFCFLDFMLSLIPFIRNHTEDEEQKQRRQSVCVFFYLHLKQVEVSHGRAHRTSTGRQSSWSCPAPGHHSAPRRTWTAGSQILARWCQKPAGGSQCGLLHSMRQNLWRNETRNERFRRHTSQRSSLCVNVSIWLSKCRFFFKAISDSLNNETGRYQ